MRVGIGRDNPGLADILMWEKSVRIIHVPEGPAQVILKGKLLPYMGKFTDYIALSCPREQIRYVIIHANFWMSGLVAADLRRRLGIP
jgi:hypothetical protein